MRALQVVFLGMFVYGLWASIYGGAILSLMMFAFILWAERKFEADDKAWANDPRNAKPLAAPTSDAMADHECESARSRF